MNCHVSIRHLFAAVVLIMPIVLLSGCGGGYVLRGKVIESNTNAITTVDRDDSRMDQQGLGNVQIRVYRDPGRLSQELAASGVSGPDGTFAIPIDAFGAGWMDESWLIQTYRDGYSNAETIKRLPGNTNRRPVLIMLRRGDATPFRQREDLLEELERYR